MPTPIPIVLDTDVGADPDDALALLLALASPEVDLQAVTIVSGDVDLRARIASRLLGMAGRTDIPIVKGLGQPPQRGQPPAMLGTEGQGLLDLAYAGPEAPIADASAPEWLVERSRRAPVHLVTIGPLSNAAAALRLDPTFADRLLGLTAMGGLLDPSALRPTWRRALHERAIEPASLDYNTASDPPAALVCARSGVPLTWVPIEVTFRAPLHRAARDRFQAAGGWLGAALAGMLDAWQTRWFRSTLPPAAGSPTEVEADAIAFLHDPLALAALFPGEWLRLRRLPLRYDLAGGLFHLRQTAPSNPAAAVAAVAVAVDGPAFERFAVDRIARLLSTHPV